MQFTAQHWRAGLQDKLHELAVWLDQRRQAYTPFAVYGALAGMTLWPLVEFASRANEAGQPLPISLLITLGSIAGGVGSDLVAGQVQRWLDRSEQVTPQEIADWVAEAAANNQDIRTALDNILRGLETIPQTEVQLAPATQQWFLTTLQTELAVLGSSLTDILAGIRENTARTATATKETADLLRQQQDRPDAVTHYLKTLISRCEPVDLPAIDETFASGHEPGVNVSQIFTPLYLARSGQIITRRPQQAIQDALFPSHPDDAIEKTPRRGDEKAEPISAVAAVAALHRLVILGYPGGGKSTLVNYIAARLARRCLGQETDLDGWPAALAPLPVVIVLRRFAAWLPDWVPAGEESGLVWDYIAKLLRDMGCSDAFPVVQRTLRAAGGILFFDGLDEVRESDLAGKRTLIKDAVQAFSAPLKQCRFVVTCREYAYKQGDDWVLSPDRFPSVELALFEMGQIRAFTGTWYQLVGPGKGWSKEKSAQEAKLLAAAVEDTPHLYDLARYPLLLTLMAQVHGRDGTLPEDRADLYDRAVKLLLSHWESRVERESGFEMRSGLIAQLGVRSELLRSALARVAFEAHEQQETAPDRDQRTADISRDTLWDILAAELGSRDKAVQVTTYIQDRAGLLQARDNYTFTFPHRSFQEYLAAAHIWGLSEPEERFKERVRRDLLWWQEVFLLAAGMMTRNPPRPPSVANLVDTLVPPFAGGPVPPEPVRWAQLASQALRETNFLQAVDREREREDDRRYPGRLTQTLERVQAWLLAGMTAAGALTISERADAGRFLGLLADPRFTFTVHNGVRLPDIAWGEEVPPGNYPIGGDPDAFRSFAAQIVPITHPYRLSCYPITCAQFACFVTAPDFTHEAWWRDMPQAKYLREISPPAFNVGNHPRDNVSWYHAVAFCRWLSAHLGYDVDLPTEYEWEIAARYPDLRFYPWGNDFDPAKANTSETRLNTTTAVGLFPAGDHPALQLSDMSGNVWEWCRNKDDDPLDTAVDRSNASRALRGGSWIDPRAYARAASRVGDNPGNRFPNVGFRVAVRRPPSQDH